MVSCLAQALPIQSQGELVLYFLGAAVLSSPFFCFIRRDSSRALGESFRVLAVEDSGSANMEAWQDGMQGQGLLFLAIGCWDDSLCWFLSSARSTAMPLHSVHSGQDVIILKMLS